MPRQEIDLTTPQPNGKMGEPTKTAWEKVNDMTAELYSSDLSPSVPKTGGEAGAMSGNLILRGGGVAARRMSISHNANASNDFGAKVSLLSGSSTTDLGGLFLVPTGSNGYETQFQVWLKDGDFYNSNYVSMLVVTRNSVSFRGNNIWHAGNTTVDANNFIKRA